MREYADEHDEITIVQLPSYTPDFNPAEGIWSLLRRGPAGQCRPHRRRPMVAAWTRSWSVPRSSQPRGPVGLDAQVRRHPL
ncbi:hypothetical protein AB0J05_22425 [Streptomyces phaeochromogenes]